MGDFDIMSVEYPFSGFVSVGWKGREVVREGAVARSCFLFSFSRIVIVNIFARIQLEFARTDATSQSLIPRHWEIYFSSKRT